MKDLFYYCWLPVAESLLKILLTHVAFCNSIVIQTARSITQVRQENHTDCTCTLVEYRYKIGWLASYRPIVVPAVVYALLFGIVELEEQHHVVFLVEVWQCTETRVRRQHLEEDVPWVHVFGDVCYRLVLVVHDVQACRSTCLVDNSNISIYKYFLLLPIKHFL